MIKTETCHDDFVEQAKHILSEMTFEEKVQLLAGNCKWTNSMGIGDYNSIPYGAGGCKRLGVPELLFCDGPRGCVCGQSTCFPVTMARGATFDPALEMQVGQAIAEEIRAHGGNFYGGVCINIPYNPGAGRSQETYGEDSYHIGKMAEALVRGIQSKNVIACIKHFAFNSMENARFWVNVTADKRTEREVFLPHFKRCIDAGASAVMSSYNRYNGKFNGSNPYLLRDILKREWKFDGIVMSDFMMGLHSTAGGLKAGLDVEMNIRRKYTVRKVGKAIKKGKVTTEQLDEACFRILRTLLSSQDACQYDKNLIACDSHITLARRVAEQSLTLIRNHDHFLPLDASKIKHIAVVGNLANTENIGDNGSSQVHPPYVKTFLQGLEACYPDVQYTFIHTNAVRKNAECIRNADAVIIVCGMRHSDEGEYIFVIGGDRKKLGLRKRESEMIHKVSSLNNNTAVVVMGGNAITMHEWKDEVKSILFAYYPGMEGGCAIADVLFGKVNPSGKLPFAIAAKDSDYPSVKWMALHQHYGYYHGYRKLDKENITPDFPYGFGLSYTTFAVGLPVLQSVENRKAYFSVPVKNTGDRVGSEVIQLYISFVASSVDRPVRKLVDFSKITLNPQQEQNVILCADADDLAYYDEQKGFVFENITYGAHIGTDERNCRNNSIFFRFVD